MLYSNSAQHTEASSPVRYVWKRSLSNVTGVQQSLNITRAEDKSSHEVAALPERKETFLFPCEKARRKKKEERRKKKKKKKRKKKRKNNSFCGPTLI
ncbi:hypothetical protein GRJ2_000471600 [Grus japonensis]|uniref:Uncharacterized protein n=1 Tax=Grus japonensis TaxID=30415 RepID=A0ABC9W3E6_GRUJA